MPRLQRWYRHWLALLPWERRLLLRLLWRLPLCKWQLGRAADPACLLRARQAVRPAGPLRLPAACTPARFAARCAALVQLAARQPWITATCLPQALVLHTVLQEHGVPALLRLGVAPTAQGNIAAHAWVEQGGMALGADVANYTAFQDFAHAGLPLAVEPGHP